MSIIPFHSKECKTERHSFCQARWEGLGFHVFCDCQCHSIGCETTKLTSTAANNLSAEDFFDG